MKKLFALFLSLVMILFSAASVLAENPAEAITDAGEQLLFRTENVTLNGKATFSLDGTVFKVAEGTYIQDGENSFWQLKLHTPRPTAPELGDRESGYTIIADNGTVYVMEVYYPGRYRTGTVLSQSTILRPSVQLDLMVKFVRELAKQADTLLGENAFTVTDSETGGSDIRITLDENVPDLVHTALTLLYQYAGERYFHMNFDNIQDQYMGPVSNYVTVTQGILYTTKYLYLKQADVRVVLDASGELQAVSGTVSVYLQTGGDGEHLLDVEFSLDVTDLANSKVEPFDPEQYGVAPANAFSAPQPESPARTDLTGDELVRVVETVRAAAAMAGCTFTDYLEGYAWKEADGSIFCGMYNSDRDYLLTSVLDADGNLLRLTDESGRYNESFPQDRERDYPDQQLVQDTKEKLMAFLQSFYPAAYARIEDLEMEFSFEANGVLYFTFEEYPHRPENSVSFIVRVLPEFLIDDYSSLNMG